jgi:hypothetical protein
MGRLKQQVSRSEPPPARARPAALPDQGGKSLQVFGHLQGRNLELYEETLKEARLPFEPGEWLR